MSALEKLLNISSTTAAVFHPLGLLPRDTDDDMPLCFSRGSNICHFTSIIFFRAVSPWFKRIRNTQKLLFAARTYSKRMEGGRSHRSCVNALAGRSLDHT